MEITDVRLRRMTTEGKMKAVASVTLDGEFVIHDVKVVEGLKGLFVAMPSRRTPDGEFRDVAHPITPEARERIQRAVLAVFHNSVERGG
ncbi:MAG: septation regulator SpoVG [Firmicutes bacterium]|nr:septation regulator SpoVG [Alicyclobacillaceae bacterium]MCL6497217.1 septation regulator SpoVG [Bacillota bacterium]